MKIPKIFVPEKNLGFEIERLLNGHVKVRQKYDLIKVIYAHAYAEGITNLKKLGQEPFTFAENVEARIANYEMNDKGVELFKVWLDSVTGIAYKAHSTRFKLILKSDKLENILKGFNQSFIPIDYDAEQGVEFDSEKGKYNQPLTKDEAKAHEFWLAAMNGNKEKLAKYVDIWFDRNGKGGGMGVYLTDNPGQDELRELALSSDFYSSNANGDDLQNVARFLSGAK